MDKDAAILNSIQLQSYIEFLRTELIDTGFEHGLNHELTIKLSEELDHYINEYQRMTR